MAETPNVSDPTKNGKIIKKLVNLRSHSTDPLSEAQGSQELRSQDVLPKPNNLREIFEAMGFIFGADVDDLFIACEFPNGWKKVLQNAENPRHIDILDQYGRKRGYVFYRNSMCKRITRLQTRTRISTEVRYISDGKWLMMVKDGELIIHSIEDTGIEYQEAKTKIIEWAKQRFPEMDNPLAYWEVDDLKTMIG